MGPFLGARHLSAPVPHGHHSPRIRQADVVCRPADWVVRFRLLRQPALIGFSTAPVGTRPWMTKRHSATSNLRASAVMAMRLMRPCPSRTRSRYQALSGLSGWLRSHSQASCPMVLRTRALPAFEMPCS